MRWERALAEAYDVLITCPACHQTFIYPYWLQPAPRRQCPFCGANARAPFPAVMELLESRAKGTLVLLRTVLLYHGLPLFADVTEPTRLPPFTRREAPVIGQTIWDAKRGVYRLTNSEDIAWLLPTGERIKRGESVALHKGTMIKFGDDKRVMRAVE